MAKTTAVITITSEASDKPVDRHAALVVIYGLALGRKYDLTKASIVIGRSSRADIQLDQDSVSRNHARVTCAEGTVTLEDLGSKNGTYVNDELAQGSLSLRNGDLIKVGRTVFKFIAGGNIETAYHDEIYRLTTLDGLTQVFNRRHFEETLDREISRCNRHGRELALILIDIDHFKQINDTFGHLAGDYVLNQLASRIKSQIRREDIFARYGGEEFALLLPELDRKGALLMAERARKMVEQEKFLFDKQEINVTISLGVGTLDRSKRNSSDLIREADARLYEAKTSGRNRVCA